MHSTEHLVIEPIKLWPSFRCRADSITFRNRRGCRVEFPACTGLRPSHPTSGDRAKSRDIHHRNGAPQQTFYRLLFCLISPSWLLLRTLMDTPTICLLGDDRRLTPWGSDFQIFSWSYMNYCFLIKVELHFYIMLYNLAQFI